MFTDLLWRCSLCLGKKLDATFLTPIKCLISCMIFSTDFVSLSPCRTNIKQFFLASWVIESLSPVFMVVGMISLWNAALNRTIFSTCTGVGATSQVHVSVTFFWTHVISSSWHRLKLSSRIFLKRLGHVTLASDGLLILTDSKLFLAIVLKLLHIFPTVMTSSRVRIKGLVPLSILIPSTSGCFRCNLMVLD